METNYTDRMADKRTIAEKYGNKEMYDRKLKASEKYKKVSKVVNTGLTIKDVKYASDNLISKRKSELFKRLKGHTIIKLLKAQQQNQTESIYNVGAEEQNNLNDENKSNITDVTHKTGVTGVTAVTYATDMLGNLSDIHFLLLDLREENDYFRYHIREALSFPGILINRDKFLPEMLTMKSQDGKMVIVYHNDERNGIPFAQRLFEKGFDNVYFLSGGIEDFAKKFPEYLEGPEREKFIQMKIEKDKKDAELLAKQNPKKNYINKNISSEPIKHGNVSTMSSNMSKKSSNVIQGLKKDLAKK
jgi:centrosomal protein CEP41